jgi:hypothetical protein
MATDDVTVDTLVFRRQKAAVTTSALWLGAGIIFIGFGVFGFALAVFTGAGVFQMHAMATLPSIMGFAAIIRGWIGTRTPDEVAVGRQELEITTGNRTRRYSWNAVGWANMRTTAAGSRLLQVYDSRGRTIAKLGDSLTNFDEMAEAIRAHITSKRDSTADRIQLSKARRLAVVAGLAGPVLVCSSIAVAFLIYSDRRAVRLLEDRGVPGEADIVKTFLAPDGVTRRLIYRVKTPAGNAEERNAEVQPVVWAMLTHAKTVQVRYVPDEPSISRLAVGEVEEDDPSKNPLLGYGASAFIGLLGLACIAAVPLFWRGQTVDWDSKARRFRIKPYGTAS